MDIVRAEPDGEPRGTAVIVHGFTRSPADLEDLSQRCVAMGARTLRPALGSLWWPSSTNNASHLDAVAEAIRPLATGPVVVVGHSAGASAGSWIAADLQDAGVALRGLVMVDGVESPSGLIRRAWPRLADVPVTAVCAAPSRCNRHGALATWLAGQGRAVHLVTVPGSGHGDIEGRPRTIYRWACGDAWSADAANAVMEATLGAVAESLQWPRRPTPGP